MNQLRDSKFVPIGLSVLATIVLFPRIELAPGIGPDHSWRAGLVMARSSGLRFGDQIAFTYGPLGFLAHPEYWGRPALLAILLFLLVTFVQTYIGTCWLSPVLTTPIAAGVSALLVQVAWQYEKSNVTPIAYLLVGFGVAALLRGEVLNWKVKLAFAALGGFVAIAKVDTSTYVLAASASFAAAGHRRFRDMIAPFIGQLTILGAAFVAWWIVAGQRLSDLGNFLLLSAHITLGFNENMVFRSPPFQPRIAILGTILMAFLVGVSVWRKRKTVGTHALIVTISVVTTTTWMAAKSGFVRFDGHAYRYVWFLAIIGLVATHSQAKDLRQKLLAGASTLLVFALIFSTKVPNGLSYLTSGPSNLAEAVRPLASPSKRSEISAVGTKTILDWAKFSAADIDLLRDKSVHAESSDISAVWALGSRVRWNPTPIIQSYSAYTGFLDEKNASHYETSTDAPEAILYHSDPGDGHHPRFQSPAAIVALLCNYAPRPTDSPVFQIFLRSEQPRCGKSAESIERVDGKLGRPLRLAATPDDDDYLIVGRYSIERPFAERLSSLFKVRPDRWTFKLDPSDGGAKYFFDPGTADQPHLLALPACLRPNLKSFDPRTYSELTIEQGLSGLQSPVRLQVERLKYRC